MATLGEVLMEQLDAHPGVEGGACGPAAEVPPARWFANRTAESVVREAVVAQLGGRAGGAGEGRGADWERRVFERARPAPDGWLRWSAAPGAFEARVPVAVAPERVSSWDATWWVHEPATRGFVSTSQAEAGHAMLAFARAADGGLGVAGGTFPSGGAPLPLPAGLLDGRSSGCAAVLGATGDPLAWFDDGAGHREWWRPVPTGLPSGLPRGGLSPRPDAWIAWSADPTAAAAPSDARWQPAWGRLGGVAWDGDETRVDRLLVAAGAVDAFAVARFGKVQVELVHRVVAEPAGPVAAAPDGGFVRRLDGGWVAHAAEAGPLRALAPGPAWWPTDGAIAAFDLGADPFAGTPDGGARRGRADLRGAFLVEALDGIHARAR